MVKVISDSTCDLSPELLDRYSVSILPLHIHLGDNEYSDGVDIFPDDIYKWSDANGETPKTAAPSIEEAAEFMKPYLEKYEEIILFTISQSMSACNNVCRLAAEELEAEERIHVIDSANLSTGIGLLVIRAAEMATEGQDAAAIEQEILRLRPLVRASFVVDTLVFLHRGGRCSGLAAMLGSALKLHPRIAVADGAMSSGKKYRGSIDRVIMDYTRDMEADLLKAIPDRVFITHSGCTEEVIGQVRTYLESLHVFKEILVTRAGSVISSHCGPGTLGVLFILKEA